MESPARAAETSLTDPVCGMSVDERSPHHHVYDGKTYFFCHPGCRAKFAADPRRYLTREPAPPAPPAGAAVAGATVYTCPMHPEVRQDRPGACPKCGMALEPELPSAEPDE